VADITNTTQLSLFSLIKTALRGNTALLTKFNSNDYYRFEPSFKSFSFSQLPFIVIQTPTTDSEFLVLDHSNNLKDFNITIMLFVDFSARDNFDTYANAIVAEIESEESTFESSGYYHAEIDLVDVGTDDIQDKKVVVGTFEMTLSGSVSR